MSYTILFLLTLAGFIAFQLYQDDKPHWKNQAELTAHLNSIPDGAVDDPNPHGNDFSIGM